MNFVTAEVEFPVEGEVHVSEVSWEPKNPSVECAAAVAAHDAALPAHENRHRDVAMELLKKAKAAPPISISGYGTSDEEAEPNLHKSNLHKEIEGAQRVFVEQIRKDYDQSVKAFHAADAGKKIFMDCGACQ